MFLVVGLALAGLAGIAAAFYFSIRSGNRGSKRLRSAGAGRTDAGRLPGSRGGRTARPGRTDNGRRAARSGTGPEPVPDSGSRRRVGFRKGADVDEELWPTEAFGGVSDEQFWDDLASDKPLTTTARTAQQDPGARNRPLDGRPATDPQSVQALGDDRKRDSVTRDGAARDNAPREGRKRDGMPRDDRGRGEGRRGPGSGAYPGPRTAPSPATERTAIQPAYAAPQPVPSMTQPVQSMTQPVQSMTSKRPDATQPVRAPASASPPMSAVGPPRGSAAQPAEPRRRRPSSAEEDPLTSAAFSLRSSGPVDGRSALRARDTTRDQYGAASSGPGSAGSHGGASPYPTPSYGDQSSVTQTMNTPPYGENYGYGSGGPAPQPDEPRRQNGTGSHTRPDGTGEGARAGRQAYPRDGRQATGSYPGNGAHPGNGHRAPYDPRDDYRRLTHQP